MNEFDAALIDRLVDGELSPEERRRMLAALDARPDGWRQCALAFLEAQSWRNEMRELIGAGHTSLPPTTEAPCTPTEAPLHQVEQVQPPQRGFVRQHASLWLATAAGLLVAFGLGRQFGSQTHAPQANKQLASNGDSNLPPRAVQPAETGDAVTLVVNDHRGVPQRVRVPLVEGRNLGDEFADVPQWTSSPELVRRLNEHGVGLAARRRYAPLYFEQQNQIVPMIVPVDDAVVTPVNRPVF